MSTICKLHPMVREERAARASLVHSLAAEESQAIKAGRHELAAKIIGARDFLAAIAASPSRTGVRKQSIFTRVCHELVQEMGA